MLLYFPKMHLKNIIKLYMMWCFRRFYLKIPHSLHVGIIDTWEIQIISVEFEISQQRLWKYCHVWGVAWRIIMGSGLDDWIYWHVFAITINYKSSQSLTLWLHSLLDYECLPFHYHEWRITTELVLGSAFYCDCLQRRLSDECSSDLRIS
jgi:hypothetical protein